MFRAIQTSTTTLQSLQAALPFFQQINQLMRQVTGAWDGLLTPLASGYVAILTVSSHRLIAKSNLRSSEKGSASWKALQGQTQSYLDTPRGPVKFMEAYGPNVTSLEATINKSTMTVEEASTLFQAMLTANDARDLEIALCPPEGMTLGVNRSTLNGIANDYRTLASILR